MRQLVFAKDAILNIDGTFISDHNRSPLSISFERLESRVRTQGGSLRKYHRADKRTVSCSWENLPEDNTNTVDSGAGAMDIQAIYLNSTGSVSVTITYDTGNTETLTMVVNSFSIDVASRKGDSTFYDVSIELEEV